MTLDFFDGSAVGSTGSTGSVGLSGTPTPEPTAPNRAEMLDEVRRWLARFIVPMNPWDLDLLTLWAAHTHLVMETYTTPRLVLDSPVPGSGKTTVLEHLERLCFSPCQAASLGSPALLARMIDAGVRTFLIDEADRTLKPDKDGVEELIAVLNSGYKRGGTRPVLTPTKDGWAAKEMSTYSPVAMAGNNPSLPEDTRSRCVRVLLMPDVSGVAEESDWELLDDEARALGARLGHWAEGVRDAVRTQRPPLPESIRGRARERWSPLKRVAHAAGGRWPSVVDELAVADVQRLEEEREDGIMNQRPAVLLLSDIHAVWPQGSTFVPTSVLLPLLTSAEPERWGEAGPFGKQLTAQRLGRMLVAAFDIRTTRDGDGPRGYMRNQFVRAWHHLGVTPPSVRDIPSGETDGTDITGQTGGGQVAS